MIALLEQGGMEAAVRGVATGGRLEPFAGEAAHPKALLLATRKEDRMPFRP